MATIRLRRVDETGTPILSMLSKEQRAKMPWQLGNEVLSSVPLQVTMYLHVHYYVVWLITQWLIRVRVFLFLFFRSPRH